MSTKMLKQICRKRTLVWVFNRRTISAILMLFMLAVLYLLYSDKALLNSTQFVASAVWRDIGMKSYEQEVCNIPKLDPFDPAVAEGVSGNDIECGGNVDLTFLTDQCDLKQQSGHSNGIVVNVTAKTEEYPSVRECRLRYVYRPVDAADDNSFKVTDWINMSLDNSDCIPVSDDHTFLNVQCLDRGGEIVYENFHAWISEKSVKLNMQPTAAVSDSVYNVLMLGVDSLSHSSFIRLMPRTFSWLHNQTNSVIFNGYNKVADNTLVNIVPILTGKTYEELTWSFGKYLDRFFFFDSFPFIWKDFERSGYATYYAEDVVSLNTFNVGMRNGFQTQPTTIYVRPFWRAVENSGLKKKSKKFCLGRTPNHIINFQLLQSFMRACSIKNRPFFSLLFLSELSHSSIGGAAKLDKDIQAFLQTLSTSTLMDNTIVFFFSDHGSRWGQQRESLTGQLEDRLPLFSVTYPKKLSRRYPTEINYFRENVDRLTSPFDFHATLRFILNRFKPADDSSTRSVSLFSAVPKQRSCAEANIESHWCACSKRTKVSRTDPRVQNGAQALVSHINETLATSKGLCSMLALESVQEAYIFESNEKVLTFKAASWQGQPQFGKMAKNVYVDIFLIVKAAPSHGIFESTVRYFLTTSEYKVISNIGRLDRYGDQAKCTDDNRIKKLCYCTDGTNKSR